MVIEFGKSIFTRCTNPEFIMLVESFDVVGFMVKSIEGFFRNFGECNKIKINLTTIEIN